MIKSFNLSLWELYTTFLTGVVSLIFFLIYTVEYMKVDFLAVIVSLKEQSFLLILILVPPTFAVGMIVEALSIIFEEGILKKLDNNLYKKPKSEFRLDKMKQYLQDKLPKGTPIEPYFWCKDYLQQNDIDTPLMTFLGKFGFYRSVAFLFYLNTIIVLTLFGFGYFVIGLAMLSLLIGFLMTKRSIAFYHHTGKTAYTNYIVATESNAEKKKS